MLFSMASIKDLHQYDPRRVKFSTGEIPERNIPTVPKTRTKYG